MTAVIDVLRIGSCSGFYGDRLSALREMLEGSSNGHGVDVVVGDYLAELTMLILGRDAMRDPSLGYARTFVRQAEDCLGLALERGVRIVVNAGGVNPAGLAEKLREVARGLGLDLDGAGGVAHVEGDDLRPRWPKLAQRIGQSADALTANAYLGGLGIAAALRAGAQVVVTGRVTDASLVLGPAVAHFGWDPADHDRLAAAVVVGHVLECGAQATGGNFSGSPALLAAGMDPSLPLGFPVAELAADGTALITKHDDTGGAVTVDTITAQLVYEVQGPDYLGPDVTTRLDSVRLAQVGPDRVAISGVRGEAPPETLKVCVNTLGGWRNSVELVLTGLDVPAKAAWLRAQLEPRLSAASVTWSPVVEPPPDAATEEAASTLLRVTVRDPEPEPCGRAFTAPIVELALASYAGFTLTGPPPPATPYGVYTAAYVGRDAVTHTVVHADGRRETIPDPSLLQVPTRRQRRCPPVASAGADPSLPQVSGERRPLGTFVHARSGDKGGDANLGLWVAHDGPPSETDRYDARVRWLFDLITPDTIRALLPEAADLDVEVWPLPNLGAVNVVLPGLLGQGVAAGTRFDPQAKGLGEWLRSRLVRIPEELL